MYKCSECGEKFEVKPDFCNCGNDCFEEITEQKTVIKDTSIMKKYDISPYALVFFIICLVLSVLVLLFFANPKENNSGQKQKNVKIQTKTRIPDIDNFWDNSAPVKTSPEPAQTNNNPVIEVIQIIEKPAPISPAKTAAKPKVIKQNSTTKTKPQTKVQQKNPGQPVKTQTAKNSASAQEVYNYKIKLRNALFSHLSAASIQGSGKCGIEFAVNSDGKLINRAFTFQSDNKTLNDEVYKMMMRMPTYSPPPDGYKGEKIKITFSFNNGSYEIHLVN